MEILRKYGVSTTLYFPLIDYGATDFESTPVSFASGDTQIIKDGGAAANTTNNPSHEGNGIYSLVLTATEMQAAVVVVTLIDSATKTWEDQAFIIATYGNASAEHAFDLDTATQTVSVTGTVVASSLTGHTVQTGDTYGLLTGAHAEPTGVPAANETALDKLGYLFMALRNKVTVTGTKMQFFDDGGTAEWEKDVSDDGTTYTESEGNAP